MSSNRASASTRASFNESSVDTTCSATTGIVANLTIPQVRTPTTGNKRHHISSVSHCIQPRLVEFSDCLLYFCGILHFLLISSTSFLILTQRIIIEKFLHILNRKAKIVLKITELVVLSVVLRIELHLLLQQELHQNLAMVLHPQLQ